MITKNLFIVLIVLPPMQTIVSQLKGQETGNLNKLLVPRRARPLTDEQPTMELMEQLTSIFFSKLIFNSTFKNKTETLKSEHPSCRKLWADLKT